MSPGGAAPRPGRAARRRARRQAPPLPQREGLDAVRWRLPPGEAPGRSALAALVERFPALGDPDATPLEARFAAGEVVDARGRPWRAQEQVGPGDELWFHRELRPEHVPAVDLRLIHRDEHLLVLDKPHDMATMPRGAHILASALVRLRRATGIGDLVPLHRLDRRTAGVLAFGIRPEERSAYQQLFARQEIDKEYEAVLTPGPAMSLPRAVGERAVLRDRLEKRRGELTTVVVDGPANAETALEVRAVEGELLRVLLHPRTGRTHQLRAQLASRGAPILGEDLYLPSASPAPPLGSDEHDPQRPLQLLARALRFTDPVTGQEREFLSGQRLSGAAHAAG